MKTIAKTLRLPRGAKLLRKKMRRKVGNWVEMEFDAFMRYRGICWYRAKDGFGGANSNHPREDWCADLSLVCASASRYLDEVDGRGRPVYERSSFEPNEKPGMSIQAAFDEAIEDARTSLKRAAAEATRVQESLKRCTKALERAAAK